ncbi:hypothetical protein HZB94_02290 [Candidatus Falkowbacteria bacterium]|nr:hypothetical protein [Candidatus Falkowbacteria bacterium]
MYIKTGLGTCSVCGCHKASEELTKVGNAIICQNCAQAAAGEKGVSESRKTEKPVFLCLEGKLVLDFLREQRGTPSISTLTVGEFISLHDKVEQDLLFEDEAAEPPGDGADAPASEPSTSRVESPPARQTAGKEMVAEGIAIDADPEKILWKLKFLLNNRIYNFRSFKALERWMAFMPNPDPTVVLVSLDGKEWKSYASFKQIIYAKRHLGQEISPLVAF